MRVPWTASLGVACFVPPSTNKWRQYYPGSRLQSIHSSDQVDETVESLITKVEAALEVGGADESSSLHREINVLNSRLSNIYLNRTYVGPSAIAGRGLFAAVDCPAGTLLTCYPGDGIVDDDDEVFWGDHTSDIMDDEDDWDSDYLMCMTDEIGLIGLPDLDQDPAYLGHFANDGVSRMPQNMQEVLTTYLEESEERANAKEQDVLNCHMALVATKDIRKDQEIFLCYGPEYWIQQPGFGM